MCRETDEPNAARELSRAAVFVVGFSGGEGNAHSFLFPVISREAQRREISFSIRRARAAHSPYVILSRAPAVKRRAHVSKDLILKTRRDFSLRSK